MLRSPGAKTLFPAARLKIEEPAFLNSFNNRQTNRRLVAQTASAALPLGYFLFKRHLCAALTHLTDSDVHLTELPGNLHSVTLMWPSSFFDSFPLLCCVCTHTKEVCRGKEPLYRQTEGRAGPRFLLSGFFLSGGAAGSVPGWSCCRDPISPWGTCILLAK